MNDLNILIIDDESLVAMELSDTVKSLQYNVVDYVTNANMTKDAIQKHPEINLILMDINLNEKLDGIALYKSLNIDTPIIYITAYKDEEHISKAIETNPLGYLVKPYDEAELTALLKLTIYKINKENTNLINNTNMMDIGEGYFFDQDEGLLYYHNILIKLTKKELLLLKLILFSTNNRVSYETIEAQIYNGEHVSDSTIRTLIYRLRSKLEHKVIESEFGFGIKLK